MLGNNLPFALEIFHEWLHAANFLPTCDAILTQADVIIQEDLVLSPFKTIETLTFPAKTFRRKLKW